MCTPKTKIEREVDRLHRRLPVISQRQIDWALRNCTDYASAHKYKGRQCSISRFIVATKRGEWQVLRSYYLYAYYRYKKLADYEIKEVMQEWFNHGKYVFYSRSRQMGYCTDAWTCQDMSIKRGMMGGWILDDPRNLGYYKHLVVARTSQFKYIRITQQLDIDDAFRAMNQDTFAETLIKANPSLLRWCYPMDLRRGKYVLNNPCESHIAPVKIAMRRGYDISQPLWRDHIELLDREGKDIRNPQFICPTNLEEAHRELLEQIERRKERERIEARRRWAEDRRLEAEARKARESKMAKIYPQARSQFFGVIIEGKGIKIEALKSVKEFYQEVEDLHHCLVQCEYYDINKHPDSLILSAKKNGKRLETIEVNLRNYTISQCYGKHDTFTKHHQDIVKLMNDNMDAIKTADKARRMAV